MTSRTSLVMTVVTLAFLFLSASSANATILTFDTQVVGAAIPQTYGDNVTGPGGPPPDYALGAAPCDVWTDNVVTAYTGAWVTRSNINYVGSGGNNVATIGLIGQNNAGQITFTPSPDPGVVRLCGFDLYTTIFSGGRVAVEEFDADLNDWSEVFGQPIGANSSVHVDLTGQDISSVLGLRINSSNWGYVAIDNISFVPEPSTIAMWSLVGLIGGLISWRRRRKSV